ncbi:uncharacterized protein LOC119113255 [Pollicipes pollicipes]|uniref:uncharacterized protein LOC119113255 n=1 Tax=Pollicipes pollicipes TaxID=41117 RepID=UPI001885290A|nr:uncharacterized protein LOC119113255 [Pollicipes pollicipes]
MTFILKALGTKHEDVLSSQTSAMLERRRVLWKLSYITLALLLVVPGCWALGATGFFFSEPRLIISLATLDVLLAVLVLARVLAEPVLRERLAQLCSDTYVKSARQRHHRVGVAPSKPLSLAHSNQREMDALDDRGLLVKRTFHFNRDEASWTPGGKLEAHLGVPVET